MDCSPPGSSAKGFSRHEYWSGLPLPMWIATNGRKFLKGMGVPDHLTCLLRSLNAGQEATIRTRCGKKNDWFKSEKRVWQDCILSPCLFSLNEEYTMQNARLNESQARIQISGRNIGNLRYVDDSTLMGESEEKIKSLWKVKEESEKSWLEAQH